MLSQCGNEPNRIILVFERYFSCRLQVLLSKDKSKLFMPPYRKIGGMLFYRYASVCPSVCLHKLKVKTRVPRGSVVKCLTRNPGVLGSSLTGSSGFFRGSVLGQDTSEPSLVLVKPRKSMNNVSCRRDMTEILLKAA